MPVRAISWHLQVDVMLDTGLAEPQLSGPRRPDAPNLVLQLHDFARRIGMIAVRRLALKIRLKRLELLAACH